MDKAIRQQGLDGSAADDAAAKALDALKRAVPATRMLDYGVTPADVDLLLKTADISNTWDDVCERLADAHIAKADDCGVDGDAALAGQEREWAAAALNIGQLAFNLDTERKVALYMRAGKLLEEPAAAGSADFQRLPALSHDQPLTGWQFGQSGARGCAVIVGGLSGWSVSYFSMARALARRGIATLLIDGPGQGEDRMRYGSSLSREALGRFAPAIEHAQMIGGGVAMIGNSFGGMIAAHVAARWPAVKACCINGAAPQLVVPEFRTAREQMGAAFGAEGDELAARVAAFCFYPEKTPIRVPVLILEGGADPLVATGVQAGFLSDQTPRRGTMVRHWPNGEHTIYNHASERNALVAAWIADRLTAAGS